MSSCQQHDWNLWGSTTQDATKPCPWCRIAELLSLNAALDVKYNSAQQGLDQVTAENGRLRNHAAILKRALLDISLCSWNNMSSRRECGILARTALDATSELLGGGEK